MATGAIIARILTQYSNKGSKAAQKDLKYLTKTFEDFGKRSAKAFGLAAAASAAFAVKIGKDAVDAAIQDQASQALLANSLRNTVGATDAVIAGTETYITAMQKQFNVVDDELRPAMAALTAATGSVTAAQYLMQTALDVSANRTVSLGTAVDAIVKGTKGQYKALGNLVPGLDAATIATKDFGKITEKVSKITQGAAAKRAQTLEFRLIGLKIAYGEILETLGYALLPVIERFVNVVTTKVLPQLEAWIALNKDKLAKSFQTATDFFIKMLAVAFAFTEWASNNTTTLKYLAILFTTFFAASKAIAFASAVNKVTQALIGLNLVGGSGFIGAMTKSAAKGGMFATLAAALAAGAVGNKIGQGIANSIPGTRGNRLKNAEKAFGTLPMSPSPSDISSGRFNTGSTPSIGGTDAFAALWEALNKNTAAITKKTKFEIATENAMKELAARQKGISGSSSIAIGGAGSNPYGPRGNGTTVIVNNAGSVITQENLVTSIVNGIERTTRRSFGTVGAFDK